MDGHPLLNLNPIERYRSVQDFRLGRQRDRRDFSRQERRLLWALVNGLFAVVGTGVAVFMGCRTAGHSVERALAAAVIGGTVLLLCESWLFARQLQALG